MKTQVCITIDTEFSIGGALAPPYQKKPVADPAVWCEIDGVSHGLGFLLDTFARYGLTGTFFVEALNRVYFTADPMRRAVTEILGQGHDVQMHLHPVWQLFEHEDWRRRYEQGAGHDRLARRTSEELDYFLQRGMQAFDEWGAPRPVAFRSGNLQHDEGLYHALARAGLTISSNIGHALYSTDDPRFHLYSGGHDLFGVHEFPVFSYREFPGPGKPRIRSMTIAGCSWSEMKYMLWQAHQADIPLVVILTHPFEFIKRHDAQFKGGIPNLITQQRLRALGLFLRNNRDCFESVTLPQGARDFPQSQIGRNTLLQSTLLKSARRVAEQIANQINFPPAGALAANLAGLF